MKALNHQITSSPSTKPKEVNATSLKYLSAGQRKKCLAEANDWKKFAHLLYESMFNNI